MNNLSISSTKNLILIIGLVMLSIVDLSAQEDWIDYITLKDKGVMSISLNLSVDFEKPNFRNLLIIGSHYSSCLTNGFPKEEGLNELYTFSDAASEVIDKTTRNRLVGIITYQCMGFDVFYVKDTTQLRDNLTAMLDQNYKNSKYHINIKKDRSWSYYNKYLYPKNLSQDFLVDQDYLLELVLQGDDLKGLRKVNHWIYFNSLKKRNSLSESLKKLNFSLDSIGYKKERKFPYELSISRKDSIDPASIYKLTQMIRVLCNVSNAEYDGWGTTLQVKE